MNAAERFRAHLEKAADCDEGVDFDAAEVRSGLTELFALEQQIASLELELSRRGDIIARVAGETLHVESADGPLPDHVRAMMQRGARAESELERLRSSSAALHSAEREVLEACVEEDRLWVEYEAGWNSVGKYDSARDARIAAVRRYRALLDGKEAK